MLSPTNGVNPQVAAKLPLVTVFPEELAEADITCANAGWCVRLLEAVMMLLLDSYWPCDRTAR